MDALPPPSLVTTDDPLPALIGALYRSILGRAPDATGLAWHLPIARDLVGRVGLEAAATELLRSGILSDEGSAHLARTIRLSPHAALGALGATLPGLDNVVSLGMQCFTSAMLKRFGLKTWSGPFDWIFSSPAMVRHCIADDFRIFLDQRYYEPVPVEARPDPEYFRCEHRWYRDHFGIRYVFNHYDALEVEPYAYFTRTVARFRTALAAPHPILFLQTAQDVPAVAPEFRASADFLADVAPGCALAVVAIAEDHAPGGVPLIETRAVHGPHRLYHMRPVSTWRATAFDDPFDELAILRTLSADRAVRSPDGALSKGHSPDQ